MMSGAGSRGRRAPRHARRGAAVGGFTLAELLAVLALLAILAGIGIGVFATLPSRYGFEQSTGSVRALLRRARAAALETRREAAVLLDVKGGKVKAVSWATLALLRLEPSNLTPAADVRGELVVEGAGGGAVTGVVEGRGRGVTPEAGRIGGCLAFAAPGAHVDFGTAPRFDALEGVSIEAYVYAADYASLRDPAYAGTRRQPPPGAGANAQYLFQVAGKGESYYLQVREDYAIEAGVRGERDPVNDPGRVARARRETRAGTLVAERWTHVAMVYDGRDLKILVDGQRRDLGPSAGESVPARLVASAAPFVVSHPDPRLSFLGALDELRLSGVVAEETFELPGDVVFAPGGAEAVRFDAHGQLDPLFHNAPVGIGVQRVRRDGSKVVVIERADIRVERSGIVR